MKVTYDYWKTTEPFGDAYRPQEDDGLTAAINALSEKFDRLLDAYDRLRASHDALLAAAKEALALIDREHPIAPVRQELRAAIAKAEELAS